MMVKLWEQTYEIDNTRAQTILGINFRELDETLVDMAEAMIALGLIPEKRK